MRHPEPVTRRMYDLIEPIALVNYFAGEPNEAMAVLGQGLWRCDAAPERQNWWTYCFRLNKSGVRAAMANPATPASSNKRLTHSCHPESWLGKRRTVARTTMPKTNICNLSGFGRPAPDFDSLLTKEL